MKVEFYLSFFLSSYIFVDINRNSITTDIYITITILYMVEPSIRETLVQKIPQMSDFYTDYEEDRIRYYTEAKSSSDENPTTPHWTDELLWKLLNIITHLSLDSDTKVRNAIN